MPNIDQTLRRIGSRSPKFFAVMDYGIRIPSSCVGRGQQVKLGLAEVEVVGHMINAEGITVSDAKKKSLVDLANPTTRQEIKQVIGLANYFRNHVRDISKAMRPLEAMIPKYVKAHGKQVLVWTSVADAAYYFIVKGVQDLPMLYQ